MPILEINNLSKSFKHQKVINNLNLTLEEHTIYGLIGKNGAGKTTTLNLILGLLSYDEGTIYVNQQLVKHTTRTNPIIGYLPDVPEFYDYLTPLEYLQLCGEITQMKPALIKQKSNELLSLVGLDQVKKQRIKGFSRGMKQRLGIVQALLNEPRLLICDEPTSALDPIGRQEVLNILLALKANTTIIFSTHILSDVERICDNIGILDQGQLILNGPLASLKAKHQLDSLLLEFQNEADLQIIKSAFKQSQQKSPTQLLIHDHDLNQLELKLFTLLSQNKITINQLIKQTPSLEDLFLEATK